MQALVVDDDRVLADLVAFTLRHEGFQVSLAYDGQSALQKWRDEQPDLIVLDLNLPKIEPDPAQPTYIENVPGLGYGFVLPPNGGTQ
jgi:CheY-like chemotaxis protein